ncbi:hypothetical protein B0H10DRAFT_1374085 [Mycena sp. CBHHK59/15]|nr:hypothetical protein B0H10DRAFT_1374085 [Mycena sp. CBHHK59/15]
MTGSLRQSARLPPAVLPRPSHTRSPSIPSARTTTRSPGASSSTAMVRSSKCASSRPARASASRLHVVAARSLPVVLATCRSRPRSLGGHYPLPPPMLSMLLNGSPVSFLSSIPISTMTGFGDDVAEGLGGLRRDVPSVQ